MSNFITDFFAKIKANKVKNDQLEEERKNKILAGDFEPIETDLRLESDEQAFKVFTADRMGLIEKVTQHTEKEGVIGRAIVGGVVLGDAGVVSGALTADSKTSENTEQSIERVGHGRMYFTNKRFIFVGDTLVSIPYDKIMEARFEHSILDQKLFVNYPEMIKSEHYLLSGEDAADCELYYKGIKNKSADKSANQEV